MPVDSTTVCYQEYGSDMCVRMCLRTKTVVATTKTSRSCFLLAYCDGHIVTRKVCGGAIEVLAEQTALPVNRYTLPEYTCSLEASFPGRYVCYETRAVADGVKVVDVFTSVCLHTVAHIPGGVYGWCGTDFLAVVGLTRVHVWQAVSDDGTNSNDDTTVASPLDWRRAIKNACGHYCRLYTMGPGRAMWHGDGVVGFIDCAACPT